MQRTRSDWRLLIPDRLDFINQAVIHNDSPDDIIRNLRSLLLISEYYDSPCFAVDVWWLFDRQPVYAHRRFGETFVIKDPIIRVAFGIVIQAICDVWSHRPCDAHSWRLDHPPGDGICCSPTTHICEKNARDFIVNVSTVWEPFLNIREGILMDLVKKENGSLQSRSQVLLSTLTKSR